MSDKMRWDVAIKRLREHLGWTQEQLAAKLGVSLPSINRWERGKVQPSRMAVNQLNTAFRDANLWYCCVCGRTTRIENFARKYTGEVLSQQFTDGLVAICHLCDTDPAVDSDAPGINAVQRWVDDNTNREEMER